MSKFTDTVKGLLDDRGTARDGTKVTRHSLGYDRYMHNMVKRKPKLPFGIGGKAQTGVSRKLADDLWVQSKSDAMQKRRT